MASFDIWASRRRKAKDLLGALAEAMEMKAKDLKAVVSYETDEEAKINFEEAKALYTAIKQRLRQRPKVPGAMLAGPSS